MNKSLCILIACILLSPIRLQAGNSFLFPQNPPELPEVTHPQLSINLKSHSFIKNNEYTLTEPGYTYPGYHFQSSLIYDMNSQTRFEGGFHLLKFFGQQGFRKTEPLFRIHHSLTPAVDLVLGAIYPSIQQQLVEPLYAFNHYLEQPIENGLQLHLRDTSGITFQSHTWLNWEQFILPGDPFREEFTAGHSTSIQWKLADLKLTVPFQALIKHKGGEIDHSNLPVQTKGNAVTGLKITYPFRESYIQALSIHYYFAGFRDLSPHPVSLYKQGYALYPGISCKTSHFQLNINYWKAYQFLAPKGLSLYQSLPSGNTISNSSARRELLTTQIKAGLYNHKELQLGLSFRGYYDMPTHRFDYSYGFYIILNQGFLLHKWERTSSFRN